MTSKRPDLIDHPTAEDYAPADVPFRYKPEELVDGFWERMDHNETTDYLMEQIAEVRAVVVRHAEMYIRQMREIREIAEKVAADAKVVIYEWNNVHKH